jgi:hypothetical protein
MRRSWVAALLAASIAGCPSNEPPPMCTTVDVACAPAYVPTFENVFDNTIKLGCGSARASCHASGGESGMSLENAATAYQSLLDGRVTANDPGCSELVVRTSSTGKDYTMPPGSALEPAERCALIRWVATGAPGPLASSGAP